MCVEPSEQDDICFERIFIRMEFSSLTNNKKRTTTSTGYCICSEYEDCICYCTDGVCLVPFLLFASLLSKIIRFGILFIIFVPASIVLRSFTSYFCISFQFGVRFSLFYRKIQTFYQIEWHQNVKCVKKINQAGEEIKAKPIVTIYYCAYKK